MLRFLTVLLILVIGSHVYAQQPLLRHYTVTDGLPSNTVYSASQDSRGFIWFCTARGVSRFDGHHFETMNTENGLPHNEIFKIKEDRWNRLWLASYGDKASYIKDGKVFSATNDALCRRIEKAGIRYHSIGYTKTGAFYLLGNAVYIVHKDSISQVHPSLSLMNLAWAFDYKNTEYFLTHNELFKLAQGKKELLMRDTFLTSLFHQGHLYASIFRTNIPMPFYDINLSMKVPEVNSIRAPVKILQIVVGDDNKIWCCTDAGVLVYDSAKNVIDAKQAIAMKGIITYNTFKDRQGNRWYMTAENGVYMQSEKKVSIYKRAEGADRSNVLSVCLTPRGKLLIGYEDGIIEVVGEHELQQIRLSKGHWNRVKYIKTINDQECIAGTDNGLYRINLSDGKSRNIYVGAQKAGSIRNNHLLFGTSGKAPAGVYNLANGAVTKLKFPPFDTDRKAITATSIDRQQNYWLGSLEGLYRFSNNTISKWEVGSTLSHSHITSLNILLDSLLAIGTHSEGVYVWNGKRLLHLNMGQGLISNICQGIFIDGKQHMWINTDKGIDKVVIGSDLNYSIQHLSFAGVVFPHIINDITFGNGKAYLGTSEGVIVIDEDMPPRDQPSEVYILTATAKANTIHYPERINLKYNENNTLVSYTAISYTDGDDMIFKYHLHGGSIDTIVTTERSISLGSLKSGSYELLVWAGNKNGKWNSQPAKLAIIVYPPFWGTIWFVTAAIVVLLSLGILLYRRRVNLIRKGEAEATERKRRMAELEMQALRAQINPHFMFNALNAIQNYYNQNDERSANYYMSAFAKLIRQTLTYSKEHWITIAEEISILKSYIELEQMRLKYKFTYEFDISPALLQSKIPTMLLQIYTENAINHGIRHLDNQNGKLNISCRESGGAIICKVSDNGVGFEKAARLDSRLSHHKSMGLKITADRIATINELYTTHITTEITDIQTLEEGQHGTIVEITIPQNILL